MNAMRIWKGTLVVALMTTTLAIVGAAMAGTIVQDAGSHHLAFEAENYDSLNDIGSDGVNWVVTSDAGATGGETIKSPSVVDFANEGEAIYNLEFTKPTDFYWVLARYKSSGSSSSDSFLTSSVNTPHSDQLRRWFDGPADQGRTIGNASAGDYFYAFLGATAAVPAGTYEFRAGIREKDVELDRFIFVDSSAGGPANGLVTLGRSMGPNEGLTLLDNLANSSHVDIPEPASLALLSLGMLVTAGMRRRQG